MILAILQARMSSTRLPGKVMMPLAGEPMIWRQIQRLSGCRLIDRLVVATSDHPGDDPLAAFLEARDVHVHRGPLDDVLARFVGAAEVFGPASYIVRLTADCPLADPLLIDDVIGACMDAHADYASNTPDERRFPKGLDAEVFTAGALTLAAKAPSPEGREHVTWDIVRREDLAPEKAFVTQDADEGEVRWTVDRPDDYEFVCAVYEALFDPDHPRIFSSDEIRDFVRSRPDLVAHGGDRRV
jgi:spore coat polysaccharide biosynthesis protein SpsF